jgi:hypothetical protein
MSILSALNEEQESHWRALVKIPPERRCWCGWSLLGECWHCSRSVPDKTCADKIAASCPECHNDPGPYGPGPIVHFTGCSKAARTPKEGAE